MVPMFLMISIQVPVIPSMWECSIISNPKILLTCPDAIVIAAADVNPAITGTDIKSITTPSLSIPRTRIIMPLKNARSTAKSGPFCTYDAVIRAIIAVGPTVISLELPKIRYMKHPINAEYSPY